MVEITTQCRKVPIDISFIEVDEKSTTQGTNGAESVYGGATVYEAGKTPMNYNTPSYYPQSPHWGAINSPGYDYGAGMSPTGSRPGSEHRSRPGTPRADNWVKRE